MPLKHKKKIFWYTVAVLALLFTVACSLAKSLEYGSIYWDAFESGMGGDLVVHVVFSWVIAFCLMMAITPEKKSFSFQQFFHPFFCLLLVGFFTEELFQSFIPSRQFSWWDMAGSWLGALLGNVQAQVIRKYA
ncbi:hypothetical protein CI610_01125 [invertebrate metagenome]|uniref:VanZ-like domain-containing protein n=1 Tax=invertebrate metagenome TaxID=1711999 RepID=A0A2H9T9G9_9ZZZZ